MIFDLKEKAGGKKRGNEKLCCKKVIRTTASGAESVRKYFHRNLLKLYSGGLSAGGDLYAFSRCNVANLGPQRPDFFQINANQWMYTMNIKC